MSDVAEPGTEVHAVCTKINDLLNEILGNTLEWHELDEMVRVKIERAANEIVVEVSEWVVQNLPDPIEVDPEIVAEPELVLMDPRNGMEYPVPPHLKHYTG